jgi:CDP-diacylglycerol---serine O-phosphatidyltransferase
MNIKKHIPNIITLLNLLSGCIALVFTFLHNYEYAFYFVCLGIFFDFFDGFFARLLKVSSPLGLQLDSLADMVTSGVVPGFVMFTLLADSQEGVSFFEYLPYFGFIITMGACYRLAKFNIDTRQSDSFIGLPTPANSLVMLSLPLIIISGEFPLISELLRNHWVLMGISVLSAYVMNAEIPLFSLKVKDFSFEKYKLQIFFLLSAIILLSFFTYLGIPLIIMTYVLLSVFNNALKNR